MKKSFGVPQALVSLALIAPAIADTGSDWIAKYIHTQGGCAGFDNLRGYLDAPYSGYLFGKPARQWTPADVTDMRAQVILCEQDIERRSNSPSFIRKVIENGDRVIAEVPKRVLSARQSFAREETDRASRMDAEAKSTTEAMHEQEAKEANETRVRAERDQVAAAAQLKDTEAKSQAIIAAAHARRDAALARQQAAALEAEAKAAQAEADRAERAASALIAPPLEQTPAPAPRIQAARGNVPTFAFSDSEFRKSYNVELNKEGGSGIADCARISDKSICRFDKAGFDKAVAALKQLDVVNGYFEQKTLLAFRNEGNKVAFIVLDGDRSDPANLFQFIGKTSSLIQTLDGSLSADENAALVSKDLGLMRGDSDPTIGEEKTIIRSTFAASCNQYAASESTKLHCEFVPRS